MVRAAIGCFLLPCALWALGPEPGSIYKEYRLTMPGNAWRVTDPDAGHAGAQEFLPNPILTIPIDDLDGAIRAEALIDRWGGHPGTSNKGIRLNGNAWIRLPELTTTPAGHEPVCYMSQDNPTVEIPLEHLKVGANTLEATSGDQICYSFRWGQWGWNGIVLRIYYGAEKPHPAGRVTAPTAGATLGENPVLEAEASYPAGIDRVDFLAHYEGYDEDGDGVFRDWHQAYFHNRRIEPTIDDPRMSAHAGTARTAPYRVSWPTRWVPDQAEGELKILARVRGKDGTWFVTDAVQNLSLTRKDSTVRLHKPSDVPERHWVRAGGRSANKVHIPEGVKLEGAIEAAVHVRTWNGHHEQLTVNGWSTDIGGGNHIYAYTVRPVPPRHLKNGENVIGFHSTTEHHGVEVLWPGAALIVRYQKEPSR